MNDATVKQMTIAYKVGARGGWKVVSLEYLDEHKINEISPKGLAEVLGVTNEKAGHVLRAIKWYRTQRWDTKRNLVQTIYFRHERDMIAEHERTNGYRRKKQI